jgi:molybdopterin molybdotransferase
MPADRGRADWVSVEDARVAVLRGIRPIGSEMREVDDCLGAVLTDPVVSTIDLPPWDNSAMDGFAVRSADIADASETKPVRLRVVDDVPAGAFPKVELRGGDATRVMTGAPVPAGADSVVRVEHTDGGHSIGGAGATVLIHSAEDADRNIRRKGEDLREGSEIIAAGCVLRPADLGIAAATGHARLRVRRRPVVAILATGDELVPIGDFDRVRAGKGIVSSNTHTLTAQLRESGFGVRDLGIARDTPASIRGALESARGCDALITSAGVSVGEHDHVRSVIRSLGITGNFWRVRMRPGSPFAFGLLQDLDGIPWFGLPGNPVSSMVTFEILVRPALLALAGHSTIHQPVRLARLADSFHAAPGLTHFLRVRMEEEPGAAPIARLTGSQGSGILSSMVAADALLAVPGDGSDARGGTYPAILLGGRPLTRHPGFGPSGAAPAERVT